MGSVVVPFCDTSLMSEAYTAQQRYFASIAQLYIVQACFEAGVSGDQLGYRIMFISTIRFLLMFMFPEASYEEVYYRTFAMKSAGGQSDEMQVISQHQSQNFKDKPCLEFYPKSNELKARQNMVNSYNFEKSVHFTPTVREKIGYISHIRAHERLQRRS